MAVFYGLSMHAYLHSKKANLARYNMKLTIVKSPYNHKTHFIIIILLLFRLCLKCRSMVATKVKGTVTKLRKSRSRFRQRLSKWVRFKSLLKQLNGSSLLDIVRQVVPQTRAPTAKERSPNKTVLEGGGMMRRRCDYDLRHRLDKTSTQ